MPDNVNEEVTRDQLMKLVHEAVGADDTLEDDNPLPSLEDQDDKESGATDDVPAPEPKAAVEESQPQPEPVPSQEKSEDVSPSGEKVVVKTVDGEVEVTLDELQKGYMRMRDYTRKTQAVAQERRYYQDLQASLQQQRDLLAKQKDSPKSPDGDEPIIKLDDEFMDEREKRYAEAINQLNGELKFVRSKLSNVDSELAQRKSAEHQNRVYNDFVREAPTYGIPESHYPIVELLLDRGQKQYAGTSTPYLMEHAFADYQQLFPADAGTVDPIEVLKSQPELKSKYDEGIIAEYNKRKAEITESMDSPSVGGTSTAPRTNVELTPEEAKALVMAKIRHV